MSLGRLLAAGRSLMGIKDKTGRYQMRPAALLPKFVSDKNPFGTTPVPDVSKPEPKNGSEALAESPNSQPVTPMGRRRAQGSAATESPAPEPAKPQAVKPQPAKHVTPSLFDPAPSTMEALTPCSLDEAMTCLAGEKQPLGLEHGVPPSGGKALEGAAGRKTSSAPDATDALPAKAGTPYPDKDARNVVEPNVTRPLPAPAKPRTPLGTWLKKLNPLTYASALLPAAKPATRVRPVRTPVQAELTLERVKVVRNDLSDADLEVIPARPAKPVKVSPASQTAPAMEPELAGRAAEPTAWGRLSSRWFGAGQTTQVH